MLATLQRMRGALIFSALITVLILILFRDSFQDGMVVFSSDGPLSTLMTSHNRLPQGFEGKWQDINKLGKPAGAAPVNLTWLFLWSTGPVFFAKFYIPLTLVFLGISIWTFFRSRGFPMAVAGAAGFAGVLNSNFFSYGCWGLGTIVLSAGLFFLAMATWRMRTRFGSVPSALASGTLIGLCVMEGFDVGIILSILFALWCVWDMLGNRLRSDPGGTAFPKGLVQLAILVGFSVLVAMQTVFSLFSTQVQGVSVLEEAPTSLQNKWDWATQWSLPLKETIRIAIPGFYGYRMDTPEGGVYRGNVGRDPQFGTDNVGRIPRHSGSGFYSGITVLLVALFAGITGWSGRQPFFDAADRHWIRFWVVVGVLSLGLSYGRHFILYGLIHPLPFFNSIRNPIKFLHPMSISVIILFAYGFRAMLSLVQERWTSRSKAVPEASGNAAAGGVPVVKGERSIALASKVALAVPVLALLFLLMVAGQRKSMEAEISRSLTREGVDAETARQIPEFVVGETFRFFVFSSLTGAFLFVVLSGRHGSRLSPAIFTGTAIGLVVVDLGMANRPWIQHVNAGEKYVEDHLVQTLRPEDGLSRGRVGVTPAFNTPSPQLKNLVSLLEQLYRAEWLQHQFPYFDIASIDIPQESRPSADFEAFRSALSMAANPLNLRRFWELTSTRYILGLSQGGLVELFNQQLDQGRNRFEVLTAFTIDEAKVNRDNNVETLPSEGGPFAVIEFKGALDRATAYSAWNVETNLSEVLKRLPDPSWDPSASVFVSPGNNGVSAMPSGLTKAAGGSTEENPVAASQSIAVEIIDYKPTRMEVSVTADAPCVLMTTDKFDPDWEVRIDGSRAELLRCNFICRGVFLDKVGKPVTVVFEYTPPATPLRITGVALAAGTLVILLCPTPLLRCGRKEKPKTSDSDHQQMETGKD